MKNYGATVPNSTIKYVEVVKVQRSWPNCGTKLAQNVRIWPNNNLVVNFGQNVVEETVILKRNDVWSGAKVGESCRSRKMLQPECFRVKIGFDTAGNEPPQRSFQGPYVARENKSLKNVSIRCQ